MPQASAALPSLGGGALQNGDMTLGVPLVPVVSAGQMTAQTAAYGWSMITNGYNHPPSSTTRLMPDDAPGDLALQISISQADIDDYSVAIGQNMKGAWKTASAPGAITLTYSLKVPVGQPALFTQAVLFTTDYSGYANVDGHTVPADGVWHTYTDTYYVVASAGDPGNANWLLADQPLGWLFLALYANAGETGGQVSVDDVSLAGALAQ